MKIIGTDRSRRIAAAHLCDGSTGGSERRTIAVPTMSTQA